MATYYFHVSRNNTLRAGQVIKLGHDKAALQSFHTDRAAFLAERFPDGVTQHGWEYLLNDQRSAPNKDEQGLLEIVAELIRREKYPYRPSRFQSFFAWRSLSDALRFAQDFALRSVAGSPMQGTLWQVEAEEALFESDMNLLRFGTCWLDIMIFMDRYWRQEYLPNPLIEVLLSPPITIVKQIQTSSVAGPGFL